jgi:HlyD family secretion protein
MAGAVSSTLRNLVRGSGKMPTFIRINSMVCLALLAAGVPGPLASAQQRKTGDPDGRKGIEVNNLVDGPIPIISLKPNGSRVEKGDLVCELESFALREKLAIQEGATRAAETAYNHARLARETAELGVKEYLEGTYKQEIQTLNGRIVLAETGLKRAEKRLADSKRLFAKGIVPRERVSGDEVVVQRARLALEKAQGTKQTLEKYTKEKKTKILQSEVEKARSEELARQAVYLGEQTAQERLNTQIKNCKLLAPASGRLVYSSPIEVAADVVKGQLLFRVIPEDERKDKEK